MGLFEKIKGAFGKMGGKFAAPQTVKDIFDINGVPSFRQFYESGILIWKRIYRGYYSQWHDVKAPTINDSGAKRRRDTLNAGKAVCSELAGLIWAERCSVGVSRKDYKADEKHPDKLAAFVEHVLNENNFNTKMREHIEQVMALGGGTLKTWCDIKKDENGADIKGSEKIKVGYGMADQFVPLAWNNAEVTEGVFISREAKAGYYYTRLEFHHWDGSEYVISNELYRHKIGSSENQDIFGERVPLNELYVNLSSEAKVSGLQRSLFSYYRTNIANNLDDNSPLGVSIYANALSTLKALDVCFDSFVREFTLGKKRIIVPSSAIRYVNNPDTGQRCRYFDADDEVYEAMDTDDLESLQIKDNTVELRVEEHEAAINAFLGILSFQLGLSPGTLTFDKVEGLKTATEVISEKSKTYKTVKQHQSSVEEAVKKLVRNIIDVAILYGIEYEGESVESLAKGGYDIAIFFDDAIIQDRQTNINEGVLLVSNSLMSKKKFMTDKLGYTPEEADAELGQIAAESNITGATIDFSTLFPKGGS